MEHDIRLATAWGKGELSLDDLRNAGWTESMQGNLLTITSPNGLMLALL